MQLSLLHRQTFIGGNKLSQLTLVLIDELSDTVFHYF